MQIQTMVSEWHDMLQNIKNQAEADLTKADVKEYQSRIAVLQSELQMKNIEIEQINVERSQVERTVENALLDRGQMSMGEQKQEIEELN